MLAKRMAKRTRKMWLNLLRSPEMCRPWWTPARLHQIACNQKYCAATKTRSSGDVDILSHTKGVYFDQYLSDCEQLYCLWVKISKSGPKYCLSIGFHKNCDPTQMSMFPLNCIILSFHQQCDAKLLLGRSRTNSFPFKDDGRISLQWEQVSKTLHWM